MWLEHLGWASAGLRLAPACALRLGSRFARCEQPRRQLRVMDQAVQQLEDFGLSLEVDLAQAE